MRILLTTEDVKKILMERFGEADFEMFYEQSDEHWEKENNKKISELKERPDKKAYRVYF